MTDYERGYEQGKADAAKKMHPEMRKMWEDYFDKCFKEYDKHLRPWVGLTDQEIRDLWSWSATEKAERTATTQQHAFAHAIETKLKEKNGG